MHPLGHPTYYAPSLSVPLPAPSPFHPTPPNRSLVSSSSGCSYFSVVSASEVPSSYNLDPHYEKAVLGLIPCVGSSLVSDEALLSCAKTTSYMLAGRPDIAAGLLADKVKYAVMAPTEITSDIPEHSDLNDVWPGTPCE